MIKIKSANRANKRYILMNGKREDVERAILDYIGILGWARANPVFIKSEKHENKIILSVDRKELLNVRAAFEASSFDINILKVSGTLKNL